MVDADDLAAEALTLSRGFYAAATGEQCWAEAFSDVIDAFQGTSGLLFRDTPGGVTLLGSPGFNEAAHRLYAAHYWRDDPWANFARPSGNMSAILGQEVIPPDVYEASEIWNDFSRHHVGAFHVVAAAFKTGPDSAVMLGAHRTRDMPAFDATDRLRLDLLLPHLQSALRIADRLAEAELRAHAGFAALDALGAPALVVDGAGTALFTNRTAEALARHSALRLRKQGGGPDTGAARVTLTLSARGEAARLAALMAVAARGGAGGAMRLPPDAQGRQHELLVTPLPPALKDAARHPFSGARPWDGLALVLIRQPHARPAMPAEMMEALYGLTPVEAAVASALLGGHSAEEVAAQRHISVPTVRTHVRRILEKTGAANLRALEGLLTLP